MNYRTIFFLLLFSLSLQAQTVELPSVWKIHAGDSLQYKNPEFDDAQWKKITVPSQWETQGFSNYDGYAWYRVRFTVPKKYLTTELYLFVGKVDDVDETFLNGIRIGSTGKFPPAVESAWNVQRAYKIPADLLKEENILAVRVYDGGGPGGIIGGLTGLFTKEEVEKELNLGPAPKKSYYKLTTSNGLIAAVYDEKRNCIESLLPHIFQAYDSSHAVRPFALNIRPNIQEKPVRIGYDEQTHIIRADYNNFSISYFAPFTADEKIFYAVLRGEKKYINAVTFSSENAAGLLLSTNFIREKNGDAEKYFLFSFVDSLHNNINAVAAAEKRITASAVSLVDEEHRYMKNIFASCALPNSLSPSERKTVEQSIAVLKMSQVGQSEIFPGARGQLLASLPPGSWNIAWVRDGSYAVRALTELGLWSEAKNGLQFMLQAKANRYKNFIFTDGKDYGIGMDYKISVCRYFGTGIEESDFNDAGPNIEIDGFGLFLTAFSDYIRTSNDTAFALQWKSVLTKNIADVLLHCIDSVNLIRAESGPWERHLPGKQFAYTAAVCAEGLYKFSALCSILHLSGEQYKEAADRLVNGIETALVIQRKFIKGNFEAMEHDGDYYDAGTFEIFASRIIQNDSLFRSHVAEYTTKLHVSDERRGFVRTASNDWYDGQEWVFLDTRLASAYCCFNEPQKAKVMLDFITAQAELNFHLIPELYDRNSAVYEGAIPMVGFGAGTYLLALMDYYHHR